MTNLLAQKSQFSIDPIRSLRPTARKPAGLVVEFLTRRGGISPAPYNDLNVGNRVGDQDSNVRGNFELVENSFGIRPGRLKVLHQVHGSRIVRVKKSLDENDDAETLSTLDSTPGPYGSARRPRKGASSPERSGGGADEPEADGWISDRPNLFFGIRTADCVPILAWDAGRGIVGAAHAGWKGAHAGIAGELVRRFSEDFGSRPSDLQCALGPAIGPCCYHVGRDLIDTIGSAGAPFLYEARGFVSIDLWAWNRHQLISAGLEPESIEAISFCTSCTPDQFFSHRRDGAQTGRQLSFIGLRGASGGQC